MKKIIFAMAIAALSFGCDDSEEPKADGATDGSTTDTVVTDTPELQNLADLLGETQDLSLLAGLATNTDVDQAAETLFSTKFTDALVASGPVTVFAPTNAALEGAIDAAKTAGLLNGDVADLTADPPVVSDTDDANTLATIIAYHIRTDGEILSANLAAGVGPTFSGLTQIVVDEGGTLKIAGSLGSVGVETAEIQASNGVVHVVDGVIAPLDNVGAIGALGLTKLADFVPGALVDTITDEENPVTIFAPTNAAFEAIESGGSLPGDLTGANQENAVSYHVTSGQVLSNDLAIGTPIDTLAVVGGSALQIDVVDDGGIAFQDISGTSDNAKPVATFSDIVTTTGVIHQIDQVLWFQ